MSFLWFNVEIFRPYLRAKFKNNLITEHNFGNENYQKLYKIMKCFPPPDACGMQHDISGHVPHPFDIKTKTPYQFRHESRIFGDVCLETAQTISDMTDRMIAVSWSGGIDSTAVLVAFMQTIPNQRLVVLCNQASIDEFPSFYEHKIRDRVKTINPKKYLQHYQDFLCVSGDGGDTKWGYMDEIFWQSNSNKLNLPWQDCIDQSVMPDIDFVQEFCTWSGREIKSWLDLRVWFYLCCKSQDKCMHPYNLRREFFPEDIVSFYDTAWFQNWTMNNLDRIIGKKWDDYKMPAKEFIFQYHDDVDYLRYKSKRYSRFLEPDLVTLSNLQWHNRIAVHEDWLDFSLASWPFIDYAEIEDFNDQFGLIPPGILGPAVSQHSEMCA